MQCNVFSVIQMNVISDKLTHDPTGYSLSSREKKLLNHIDRETVCVQEGSETHLPNGVNHKEEKKQNGKSSCCCMCHNNNNNNTDIGGFEENKNAVEMVDSSCQTLSTGQRVMTQIYYKE